MFKAIKPVLLGLVCLPFVSCKKDAVERDPSTPENGTGRMEAVATVSSNSSYFPLNNGSQFTYVDSTLGGAATVTRSTQVAGDTTIEGKLFSRTSSKDSKTYSYHNANEGVTTLVSYKGSDKVTSTVLKANEPVGATWKDEFSSNGVPVTYAWTMKAKDLTKTVQGVTYNNVIQVHLDAHAVVKGNKTAFASADYFYAPNVGLIESIDFNTSTGSAEVHRVLQSSK